MFTILRTVIKWVKLTPYVKVCRFFQVSGKITGLSGTLGNFKCLQTSGSMGWDKVLIFDHLYIFFVVSRLCSFPEKYIFNIKGEKYGSVFAVFFLFFLCFQIEKSIVKKQSWIQVWLLRLSNPSFGKRKEDFNSIAIVNLFPQTALELCKNLLNARSRRIIYTNQLKL